MNQLWFDVVRLLPGQFFLSLFIHNSKHLKCNFSRRKSLYGFEDFLFIFFSTEITNSMTLACCARNKRNFTQKPYFSAPTKLVTLTHTSHLQMLYLFLMIIAWTVPCGTLYLAPKILFRLIYISQICNVAYTVFFFVEIMPVLNEMCNKAHTYI